MMPRQAWFDRRFSFDLPLGQFPNIVERLRGTPARLEERLGQVPPAILARRPGSGWSAQENAGHLLDTEPLWLQRVEDLAAGRTELAVADLQNRRTFDADHNARPLEEILRDFRRARQRLVARLEQADEPLHGRTALHPRLKTPMRLIDLAFFVAEHDDHHLTTITSLIR